jgi:hypothetical protein
MQIFSFKMYFYFLMILAKLQTNMGWFRVIASFFCLIYVSHTTEIYQWLDNQTFWNAFCFKSHSFPLLLSMSDPCWKDHFTLTSQLSNKLRNQHLFPDERVPNQILSFRFILRPGLWLWLELRSSPSDLFGKVVRRLLILMHQDSFRASFSCVLIKVFSWPSFVFGCCM